MQQPSPPYLWGAQQYPRQIDQWDDINAQNGRLQRTKTYLTLSPFNVNVNWLGYSDIVATWNFEAPNNFSLQPYTAIANANYVLCISYRVGGAMVRYMLWNAVGSVMPQNIPNYSGQIIRKNFRLEVWSTSNGNAVELNGMQFFTSVLGSLDYRYGFDGPLQLDDGIITNLSDTGGVYVPYVTNSQAYRFNGKYLVVSTSGIGSTVLYWNDMVSNVRLTPTPGGAGGVEWVNDPYIGKDVVAITNSGSNTIVGTGLGLNPGTVAIAFVLVTPLTVGGIFDNGGGVSVAINGANKFVSYGDAVSNVTAQSGIQYLLILSPNTGRTTLYNLFTGVLLDDWYGSSNVSPDGTITLGPVSMLIWEIAMYQNDLQGSSYLEQLKSYFFTTYGGAFALPLTFPNGAVSTTN